MTELREPPVLSKENIRPFLESKYPQMYTGNDEAWCRIKEDALLLLLDSRDTELLLDAQRELSKKWLKEHCYLKAKREVPEIISIPSPADDAFRLGAKIQADKMLKEVDGVAYRACKRFRE